MDARLLERYSTELEHLRSTAADFAHRYPKIAGRLALGEFECADPYVERLLEGFAFLAARIQLKIDDGLPRIAEALLDAACPHLLAPIPAMAMAEVQCAPEDPDLVTCPVLPRGTLLTAPPPEGEETPVTFRTAADCPLSPLLVTSAAYRTRDASIPAGLLPPTTRAVVEVAFTCQGSDLHRLTLPSLDLAILGSDDTAWALLEQVHGDCVGLAIDDGHQPRSLDRTALALPGLSDDEALLPRVAHRFDGLRLLSEYFAFPNRFCGLRIDGMEDLWAGCRGRSLRLWIGLEQRREHLAQVVDGGRFALHCVPLVNLFPRRCERLPIIDRRSEYHLVADRTRPADFEIQSVRHLEAFDRGGQTLFEARPFSSVSVDDDAEARFAVHRRPREQALRVRRHTDYEGSEVFVSCSGAAFARNDHRLHQIGAEAWCTNRDLALVMAIGAADSDFSVPAGIPATAIRCRVGPTPPLGAPFDGDRAWLSVSALRLNHLSLAPEGGDDPGEALATILATFARGRDAAVNRHADGLASLAVRDVVRRLPNTGPICFGRGLAVDLTFDEQVFRGSTPLVLGSVLATFLARHVTVNSFVETAIHTKQGGELVRWPVQMGATPRL